MEEFPKKAGKNHYFFLTGIPADLLILHKLSLVKKSKTEKPKPNISSITAKNWPFFEWDLLFVCDFFMYTRSSKTLAQGKIL